MAKTLGKIAVVSLFTALLLFTGVETEGANQSGGNKDQRFETLIRSTTGPDLYRAYCSSCHGSDGRGHGPVAVALKAKVPDLTLLAAHNGGQFPGAYVRKVISGDDVIAAHGSRAMPVWGPIFHQVEEDVDRGNVRLENLTKYLESIQATEPPAQPKSSSKKVATDATKLSAAQIYQRDCAACHGADLKGTGAALEPYKATPDLTLLAQRHGGNFPAAYVTRVLRNGVKIPAHGAADMPIWGATFSETEQLGEAQIEARISALVQYLKTQQVEKF